MKKSFLPLAVAGLVLFPSVSEAVSRNIVVSSNGSVVRSSSGACAVSNWHNEGGCELVTRHEETVYFDFGSHKLTETAKAKLRHLHEVSRNRSSHDHVDLIGHTDSVGDYNKNHALSHRRIDSVRDYLSSLSEAGRDDWYNQAKTYTDFTQHHNFNDTRVSEYSRGEKYAPACSSKGCQEDRKVTIKIVGPNY